MTKIKPEAHEMLRSLVEEYKKNPSIGPAIRDSSYIRKSLIQYLCRNINGGYGSDAADTIDEFLRIYSVELSRP